MADLAVQVKTNMDDDLQYREEIWAWDAQCAAVDERILTCPRCGSIMLPQFQKYEYMGAGWEEWYECTNASCGYCCKI